MMPTGVGVYTADFETTSEQNLKTDGYVRVWLWSLTQITDSRSYHGTTIEGFLSQLDELKVKKVWFHNLSFDGQFIVYYLLSQNKRCPDDFSVLIDDMNNWYAINLNNSSKTQILDSLKKFPGQSVENVQRMYGIEGKKDKPDFSRYVPEGYQPTKEEIDYCVQDSRIMQYAMYDQYKQGHRGITLSSDQFNDVKNTIGGFKYWRSKFPVLSLYQDNKIRLQYKGGWTYLNPKFQEMEVNDVHVYDVNSLYPHVMKNCPLPVGKPFITNEPKSDLYVCFINCEFWLKDGYLPTIQIKHNPEYRQRDYLTESKGPVNLQLTNLDLELMLEHYDVDIHSWEQIWNFKPRVGLLGDYIDYWMDVKMRQKREGNNSLYYLQKRYLNSPYGKTGMRMEHVNKIPEIEDGLMEFTNTISVDDGIYVPYQTFVCAWQRNITISQAQANYDNFIYADTDSIHLVSEDKGGIPIDDFKLGNWKLEGVFEKGKYLRPKTYIHTDSQYNVQEVKCAGMPDNVKATVNWDNFRIGSEFGHKLMKHKCVGGCYLKDTTFKITEVL